WLCLISDGYLTDDYPVLFDVVAAAGSIFAGLAIAKIAAEGSTASRFLAAGPSAPLEHHLLFQRPNEMPRRWLVEWIECMARSHPPAFQHCRSGDTREMEVPVPSCRNIYFPLGNHISVFYLEQQDEKDLVDLHLCNARRDWRYDGNVSFGSNIVCSVRGGIRTWYYGLCT